MSTAHIDEPKVSARDCRFRRKAYIPVPAHERIADLKFIAPINVSLQNEAALTDKLGRVLSDDRPQAKPVVPVALEVPVDPFDRF